MNDEDIKYGSLFKRSGFFKDGGGRNNWSKRFFAFNKWTMMLQLWEGEEERNFKLHGCVRSVPKRSISLLSSQLVVERGPIQRSVFGQRYPFIITNGPAFEGRTLFLSAPSAAVRDEWINIISSCLEQLKHRQKVALIQMKMVTDPDDPTFETLDNQHKIMVDLESRIKELDQKINRTHFQCKVLLDKNNSLYNKQEKMWTQHRQVEDKLYALTCEDTHPQRRFKFILPNAGAEMKSLPAGIYKHTAQTFLSKPHHRPESIIELPIGKISCKKFVKNWDLAKQRNRPVHHLENKEFYPTYTENLIVDNDDKLVNETAIHQIRQLDDSEDVDLQSFPLLNVFDLLKRENNRHMYRHIRAPQADYDDDKDSEGDDNDMEAEEKRVAKRLRDVDRKARDPKKVLKQENIDATLEEAKELISNYDEKAKRYYLVDGKHDRF